MVAVKEPVVAKALAVRAARGVERVGKEEIKLCKRVEMVMAAGVVMEAVKAAGTAR